MIFKNARYPKFRAFLLVVLLFSMLFFGFIVYARLSYQGQQMFTTLLAYSGDARAQSNEGNRFYFGQYTYVDYAKAFYWYEKAAAQKNPDALEQIINMYTMGVGVEKNLPEAFRYTQIAAAEGWLWAKAHLALCYEKGLGTPQNLPAAIEIYEGMTEKPDYAAYRHLIDIYAAPADNYKDLDKALFWAEKAVRQNIPGTLPLLSAVGYTYVFKNPPELEQAFKVLKETAAAKDNLGQFYLGELYFHSANPAEWENAADWFHQAAENGNPNVKAARLDGARGQCFVPVSAGEPQQYNMRFCFIAARGGDSDIMFIAGEAYELGLDGIPVRPWQAVEWFKKSAQLGYLPAQQRLAFMNASGEKIKKDPVEAYAWYSVIAARADITDKQRANASQGRNFAWGLLQPDQLAAAREKAGTYAQKAEVVSPQQLCAANDASCGIATQP